MTPPVPQRQLETAELISAQALHGALAEAGTVLLTPNTRLARYHKALFDQAQRAAGLAAWETPDILPWSVFIERAWRKWLNDTAAADVPALIASPQCLILWEQVIRRSPAAADNALLNTAQATRQAMSAWAMARAWHLLPAMRSMPLSDDAGMFLEWSNRYLQLCRERSLVDAAQLPDLFAQSLDGVRPGLPSRALAIGFDIVTPQQQHVFRRLSEAGVEVRAVRIAPPVTAGAHACDPVRREFFSENDELRACAWWARLQLARAPASRVAIVIPDLRDKRSRVTRELTDALLPGARAGVGPVPAAAELFNVSLGQPLAEYALVADALSLIEAAQSRPLPCLQLSGILRSPFIRGSETEEAARAQLDAALRRRAPSTLSLPALRKLMESGGLQRHARGCPILQAVLDAMRASAEARLPAAQSPHAWSRHFAAVLTQWGFPGERALDSEQHQLMAKFRESLDALAALQWVQPKMRADEALLQLRRIAADTLYQPEDLSGGNAPIQVLGVLESSGQHVDAIWITGLSDDTWPQPARANPFIPAALQRSAAVPEASAAASLALDMKITAGWLASAPQVVVSHARREGEGASEQERGASALILDIPLDAGASVGGEFRLARVLQQAGTRIAVAEISAMPLADATQVSGGARLLADQAACPFRAFARHRLAARPLEAPHDGLDAAERGELLHRALFLAWRELKDSRALAALELPALLGLVNAAVVHAIADARATGAECLVGRFAEIERSRLESLLMQWLQYERERSTFAVVASEAPQQVSFGGLRMELRLDRMDQLEDGTHALIDYKTGETKLESWLGERPDEPQLPLYALTCGHEIAALAFARVKRGERGKTFGFNGISVVKGLLPDVLPIEDRTALRKRGYASWDVLSAEWERSLAALARGFVNGNAEVDPKNGALTCARCDLHGMCRIAESGLPAALDAAEPEGGDVDE